MKKYITYSNTFIFLLSAVLFGGYSCARIGYPTGGEVDKTPPQLLHAIPSNETTSFSNDKVVLEFDEFIQLKDVENQVLISPPFAQKPEIVAKGKKVQIQFNDTLESNTTYLFQFKNVIVDNNEGNPIPSFDYVFSTGNILDSLSLTGTVEDALTGSPDEDIYVLLYTDFDDSTIAKKKPIYLTKTNKSGVFQFKYLKNGKYRMIALKDLDKSMTYNTISEKIGFIFDTISPYAMTDSSENVIHPRLRTFTQESEIQRITSSNLVHKGKAIVTTHLPMKNPKINTMGHELVLLFNPTKDTLQIWMKKPSDTLTFSIIDESGINDTLKLRRFQRRTSQQKLVKTNIKGTFPYFDSIIISFSNPLDSIAVKDSVVYIKTAKDSLYAPIVVDTTHMFAQVQYKMQPGTTYTITIPGNRFYDIYGNTNDTLTWNTAVNQASDYGNILLTIQPKDTNSNYIIQLLSEKGNIISEKQKNTGLVKFLHLPASSYKIRIIEDINKNQKWDPGNYWEHVQPEKVYYFPKTLELRANWDIEETFNLE